MICGLSDVPVVIGALTAIACAAVLSWSFGSVRAGLEYRLALKAAGQQLKQSNENLVVANRLLEQMDEKVRALTE